MSEKQKIGVKKHFDQHCKNVEPDYEYTFEDPKHTEAADKYFTARIVRVFDDFLAVGGRNGRVMVHSHSTGKLISHALSNKSSQIRGMCFAKNVCRPNHQASSEPLVLSGDEKGTLMIFDPVLAAGLDEAGARPSDDSLDKNPCVVKYGSTLHKKGVTGICYLHSQHHASDQHLVFSCSWDGHVQVRLLFNDTETNTPSLEHLSAVSRQSVAALENVFDGINLGYWITFLDVFEDKKKFWVASGGDGGQVRVHDVLTGKRLFENHVDNFGHSIDQLFFSPHDARYLVVGCRSSKLGVYDLSHDGVLVGVFPTLCQTESCRFLKNANNILVASALESEEGQSSEEDTRRGVICFFKVDDFAGEHLQKLRDETATTTGADEKLAMTPDACFRLVRPKNWALQSTPITYDAKRKQPVTTLMKTCDFSEDSKFLFFGSSSAGITWKVKNCFSYYFWQKRLPAVLLRFKSKQGTKIHDGFEVWTVFVLCAKYLA